MRMNKTVQASIDLGAAVGMVVAASEELKDGGIKEQEAFLVLWKLGRKLTETLETHRIPE